MIGEWCYFKSRFSKEMCEKILNDVKVIEPGDAIVGLSDGKVANDIRRSKVRFINSTDWRFTYIFDEMWKMALTANNDFFNVHITRLNFLQIAEYDASYQGEYKAHHDVFWINNDPIYHRKLSCVVQLSDPNTYEGGDLELIDVSARPTPEDVRAQGTAIFFPSMFMHKANPVLRGTRYSIAAWFEGPKWR